MLSFTKICIRVERKKYLFEFICLFGGNGFKAGCDRCCPAKEEMSVFRVLWNWKRVWPIFQALLGKVGKDIKKEGRFLSSREPQAGIEPATFSLRVKRSTD